MAERSFKKDVEKLRLHAMDGAANMSTRTAAAGIDFLSPPDIKTSHDVGRRLTAPPWVPQDGGVS